jgi:DNA-binding beta-propeller fold protein YncE
MSLLHPSRPGNPAAAPRLDRISPRAAIPGGCFEVLGANLIVTTNDGPQLPSAFFGDLGATLDLARPTRALVRVPDGAISSDLSVRIYDPVAAAPAVSNTLYANIGVPMAEDLHMVSNPAIDADGNLYAMVSGARGKRVPVSIYRIDRDLQMRPFVRDLLNISALAFGPDGNLYASSRSEGAIYRISPEGAISTFAESMGIATGIAFDRDGNLFVGDRSGTIFKLGAPGSARSGEIFVFATLEPSVAAYHLAFRDDGTLLVTAPTTSSHHPIYAIDPDGATTVFYQGLGRPQGMAFDVAGNLYVAASLGGRAGIVRIDNLRHAELFIAGSDLIGLCFLDDGCAALAASNTLFHVDLNIQGRPLF